MSSFDFAAFKQSLKQSLTPDTEAVCFICYRGDQEESLLLCDTEGCDHSSHTHCVGLSGVPAGKWFCNLCKIKNPSLEDVEMREISPVPRKGDRVVVYVRISSKGQDGPGREGLDTQNKEILDFCGQHSLTISGTIKDVGSGTDLAILKNHGELCSLKNTKIIVFAVSRVGRNAKQVQRMLNILHANGSSIFSVTENVSSHEPRFMNLVREAEAFSKNLSDLMKASYARRKAIGSWTGRNVPPTLVMYHDDHRRRRLRVEPKNSNLFSALSSNAEHGIVATFANKTIIGARWNANEVKRIRLRLKALASFIDR